MAFHRSHSRTGPDDREVVRHRCRNIGSTVTYTVRLTNSGQTPYSAATFTDSLANVVDDATYNAGATTTSIGTASFSSGVLSWSGALNPGDVATIVYTVTVNNPDTGDHVLTDTVVSADTGNNCVSGSIDTRCTGTVSVINTVALVISTTASVATTSGGSVVAYSITVHNATAATLPAAFSQSLNDVVDDAVISSGPTETGGVASFTNPNLTWSGDLSAGGEVTVSYSVTVNTTITGDQVLASKVASATSPGSNSCSAGSVDTRCSTAVPVARLLISQWYTETSTTPGSVVHLNGSFTNRRCVRHHVESRFEGQHDGDVSHHDDGDSHPGGIVAPRVRGVRQLVGRRPADRVRGAFRPTACRGGGGGCGFSPCR